MKILDIIEVFKKEGYWVKWDRATRDIVMYGDVNQDVDKVGVCWVATNKVIQQAIEQGIHFIISHENIFYVPGTHLEKRMLDSIANKKQLLDQGHICVYRSHDVWDSVPSYGVSDVWAKKLGFQFEPRIVNSYYQYANTPEMTVEELAKHVANVLLEDGEEGVYVYGDTKKKISSVAIGTGAGTNIFEMLPFNCDCLIVSDDGITNFTEAQFCIDNDIPLIVTNHAGCEIGGLKNMVHYIEDKIPEITPIYLEEGFHISYYLGK